MDILPVWSLRCGRENWGKHPIGGSAHFWSDDGVVKMVSLGSGGLLVGDRPFCWRSGALESWS